MDMKALTKMSKYHNKKERENTRYNNAKILLNILRERINSISSKTPSRKLEHPNIERPLQPPVKLSMILDDKKGEESLSSQMKSTSDNVSYSILTAPLINLNNIEDNTTTMNQCDKSSHSFANKDINSYSKYQLSSSSLVLSASSSMNLRNCKNAATNTRYESHRFSKLKNNNSLSRRLFCPSKFNNAMSIQNQSSVISTNSCVNHRDYKDAATNTSYEDHCFSKLKDDNSLSYRLSRPVKFNSGAMSTQNQSSVTSTPSMNTCVNLRNCKDAATNTCYEDRYFLKLKDGNLLSRTLFCPSKVEFSAISTENQYPITSTPSRSLCSSQTDDISDIVENVRKNYTTSQLSSLRSKSDNLTASKLVSSPINRSYINHNQIPSPNVPILSTNSHEIPYKLPLSIPKDNRSFYKITPTLTYSNSSCNSSIQDLSAISSNPLDRSYIDLKRPRSWERYCTSTPMKNMNSVNSLDLGLDRKYLSDIFFKSKEVFVNLEKNTSMAQTMQPNDKQARYITLEIMENKSIMSKQKNNTSHRNGRLSYKEDYTTLHSVENHTYKRNFVREKVHAIENNSRADIQQVMKKRRLYEASRYSYMFCDMCGERTSYQSVNKSRPFFKSFSTSQLINTLKYPKCECEE